MIASILRAAYADGAHATAGNLNNHIGVPLSVLALRPSHRASVVELGMNHPGEIAVLARIAQPTVALVNNAQREHQEFMATVEAVAHENGGAIEALRDDGIAVFPADDVHAPVWVAQAGARRLLRFALVEDAAAPGSPQAEVTGRARWAGGLWHVELHTPLGNATLNLRLAGQHNVRNALASTAAAIGAGVALADIVRGLEAFEPVKGRSQVKTLVRAGRACTLVDDTYNANPDSVRAAIDVLASLPGPRWLVLGDMGEVGDQGPAFHTEIGAYAAARGIESFWCAGALCVHASAAYGSTARHFADTGALLEALSSDDVDDAQPAFESALVKGSRFMAMERVVALLMQQSAGDGHAA
jgi:UDP-N-acetylmuramoyl-tripeptide--D-alanyl-D-alanine ligase